MRDKSVTLTGAAKDPKPLYQFDMSGTLLRSYASIVEASKETGISHSTLRRYAKALTREGNGYTVYKWSLGHLWSYSPMIDQEALKRTRHTLRLVYKFDEDGKVVKRYDGTAIAAKELGMDRNTLSRRLNRLGTVQVGAYEYSYSMDRPRYKVRTSSLPVRGFGPNGEIKDFSSQAEAARFVGVGRASVSCAVNGKTQTSGGWRWERLEKNKGISR